MLNNFGYLTMFTCADLKDINGQWLNTSLHESQKYQRDTGGLVSQTPVLSYKTGNKHIGNVQLSIKILHYFLIPSQFVLLNKLTHIFLAPYPFY